MAFMKYAQAVVSRPSIKKGRKWSQVRRKAGKVKGFDKTASNLLKKYPPKKYLLTHCTIIASVDTEKVPGAEIGNKVAFQGETVNRKWDDYYITKETEKFINCNDDAWDRQTLLNTYHTFIGAENYCFVPDTKVLMSDGTYKEIRDVRVGDKVITHKGRVRSVVHKFERDYEGEVNEIYVDRHKKPIVATPNHPFYYIDVETPEINSYRGSKKASQRRYYRDQISSYLRGDDIHLGGDYRGLLSVVEYLRDNPNSTVRDICSNLDLAQSAVNAYFRKYPDAFYSRKIEIGQRPDLKGKSRRALLWSLGEEASLPVMEVTAKLEGRPIEEIEEKAYLVGPEIKGHDKEVVGEDKAILLGYYLAEGCQILSAGNRGVIYVFGDHEEYLARDVVERVKRAFPEASVRKELRGTCFVVTVRDPLMSEWLRRKGGNLSHKKILHEEVFEWSKKELFHVLVSWLEGDGDFHQETSRLRGCTVSEELAYQMQRIAEICGVKSTVVFEPMKIGKTVSEVSYETQGGEKKIAPIIHRHHKWTLLISSGSTNKIFSKSRRWASQYQQQGRKRCDLAWWEGRRVHKIAKKTSKPYVGKVYNIEVEEDHSYVVDYGVAVQNCEHVQIKELSKGKIIDAVARDLGDTVYVDILVATDRKHKQLIKDIETGKVNSMSMGCSISFSRCTKCGNVAAEEEDLCDHVKHEKGSYFIDEQGKKRKVAELCGHHTDPESVTFIEASWVANPAFKGAVLRQVLNGSKDFSEAARKAVALRQQDKVSRSPLLAEFLENQNHEAFNLVASRLSHNNRVANLLAKYAFGFGDDDDEEEEEDEEFFTQLKEDIKEKIQEDIKRELQEEIEEELDLLPAEPMFTGPANKEDVNENIITAYLAFGERYANELGSRLRPVFYALYAQSWQGQERVASLRGVTRSDKVAAMYIRDRDFKKHVLSSDMYQCLSEVRLQEFQDERRYLRACQNYMKRTLTRKEALILVKRGRELR